MVSFGDRAPHKGSQQRLHLATSTGPKVLSTYVGLIYLFACNTGLCSTSLLGRHTSCTGFTAGCRLLSWG